MIRRAVSFFLFAFLLASPAAHAATRLVAVTFDDLPDISADDDSYAQQQRLTTALLAALVRQRVPAIGFVNEDKLLADDRSQDPRRVHLIEQWLDAGCEIGNHTYSHVNVNEIGAEGFEQEIIRGEATTRRMVEQHGAKLQWFRHPYLETGKTAELRDEVDGFLAAHGYRVAPVTIDDSEWIYDMAYEKGGLLRRPFIRHSYIRYMQTRFAWSEELSRVVFGREIPQVLLLHAGALNADAFDTLASMIRGRGYAFVTIDEATSDEAYRSSEAVFDGGVSWLERWGVGRGITSERFTNDPKVPLWIQRLAGAKDQ